MTAPQHRPASDIADLIAKLEAATEGSKRLDKDIARVIGTYSAPDRGDPFGSAPPYSSSIDAALTLVPEGWWAEIFARGDQPSCILWEFHEPCRRVTPERPYVTAAASVPLALTITALRARQAAS